MNDLRCAVKSLARTPGFTLVAIITLGLGIGANTSMFSILSAYMLRPTPYPDRDRIDRIYRATQRDPLGGVSPADYLELRGEMAGYGEIAAYTVAEMSLSEVGRPAEMAGGLRVSSNLFPVLGARPELGRLFRAEEDTRGNHRVLVLSHRYWQHRFGGDAGVVGRTVRVDGEPCTIVGVLPADFSDFRHLSWVDVFRPLALTEKEARDRNSTRVRLLGRRPEGVGRAHAEAFVADFGKRLARDYPAVHAGTRWRTVLIDESFVDGEGAPILPLLVALSALVVLIACSNLANLLLARTMARAREFAVRAALGGSRARVLRPLALESLLLAFAGGALAVLVALWTFDWFAVATAVPGGNGVGIDLHLDWTVLAWMFAACLATALAFGVAPAHFVQRLDLNRALKSGSRGTTADRGHRRFRSVLIVGQFALAMVLLAGAALVIRGLEEIRDRRQGWQSDHLVAGTVVLPESAYAGDAAITDFQRRALERVEAVPGVASASFSYAMPFFGLSETRRYLVAGREAPAGQEPSAAINGVSPHYFETVGTRLLRGRVFDARDTATSPRVYVINDTMARSLFGEEDAIGRRLAPAGGKTPEWGEIVGVVANVEAVFATRLTAPHQLYQPLTQEPRPAVELAVRTAGVDSTSVMEGIRTAVAAVDPDLPVRKLEPADTRIARANYQDGVLRSVLSAMAALGLGLASLGVYGVVARTVAQRTGEFGIRLALGAQVADITRLVLASGAKLALVGSALGLVGAYWVSRVFLTFYPAMRTSTATVLVGSTLVLVAVAQVASYLPARRAGRLSPSEALRAE